MLRDSITGRVCVVQYSSRKSQRVAKSVLAAELLALVDGFDMAVSIKHAIEGVMHLVAKFNVRDILG